MEKLERDKIEQENYFKVTQQDIDTLRKKETMGKLSLLFCIFSLNRSSLKF